MTAEKYVNMENCMQYVFSPCSLPIIFLLFAIWDLFQLRQSCKQPGFPVDFKKPFLENKSHIFPKKKQTSHTRQTLPLPRKKYLFIELKPWKIK